MSAGRLGIVTGLPGEARIARGTAARVLCAHGSPGRARSHAEALAASGAAGLVSFGVAGGLDPALLPGTVVIATGIATPGGGALTVEADWADRLAAGLEPALRIVRAPVAGAPGPVADAEARAALGKSSGAAAVDMESHEVGLVAAQAGLPVLAVRAIADPAGSGLPASSLAALGVGGARALVELCRRPGDWAALARLAMDYRRALAALRAVVASGGPDLAFGGGSNPGISAGRARAPARR